MLTGFYTTVILWCVCFHVR